MIQRRQKNRTRRGFTLMELLLVMAILVVMASMVGFGFLKMFGNAKEDATRSQISTLKQACRQYKIDVQRFPTELRDLVVQPAQVPQNKWRGPYLSTDNLPANGQILDPFGGTYTYNANEQNESVSIVSPGKDGQPNTQDDIPPAAETNGQLQQ